MLKTIFIFRIWIPKVHTSDERKSKLAMTAASVSIIISSARVEATPRRLAVDPEAELALLSLRLVVVALRESPPLMALLIRFSSFASFPGAS